MTNGVVDKCTQGLMMPVGHVDLETSEANETGRHAAHHRSGLGGRIAVVEDVSDDRFARGHQREGARGGDTEVMHGFTAKELTNGGA